MPQTIDEIHVLEAPLPHNSTAYIAQIGSMVVGRSYQVQEVSITPTFKNITDQIFDVSLGVNGVNTSFEIPEGRYTAKQLVTTIRNEITDRMYTPSDTRLPAVRLIDNKYYILLPGIDPTTFTLNVSSSAPGLYTTVPYVRTPPYSDGWPSKLLEQMRGSGYLKTDTALITVPADDWAFWPEYLIVTTVNHAAVSYASKYWYGTYAPNISTAGFVLRRAETAQASPQMLNYKVVNQDAGSFTMKADNNRIDFKVLMPNGDIISTKEKTTVRLTVGRITP